MGRFLDYQQPFLLFGGQYQIAMATILGLAIVLPLWASRTLKRKQKVGLARMMSLVLSVTVIGWVIIRLALKEFDHITDLPLDLCNLLALVMPLLVWRPSRRIQEVLYFLVLAGTLQAVLTPHLIEGFPHFTFFKYWIVHGGLIVVTVYMTVAFQYYPTLRSLIKAFWSLQLYAVGVVLLNLLLGSNYFYVMRKPPTASLLDYFGPWPWYILVCEGIVLVLFLLVYAPVELRHRRQRSN